MRPRDSLLATLIPFLNRGMRRHGAGGLYWHAGARVRGCAGGAPGRAGAQGGRSEGCLRREGRHADRLVSGVHHARRGAELPYGGKPAQHHAVDAQQAHLPARTGVRRRAFQARPLWRGAHGNRGGASGERARHLGGVRALARPRGVERPTDVAFRVGRARQPQHRGDGLAGGGHLHPQVPLVHAVVSALPHRRARRPHRRAAVRRRGRHRAQVRQAGLGRAPRRQAFLLPGHQKAAGICDDEPPQPLGGEEGAPSGRPCGLHVHAPGGPSVHAVVEGARAAAPPRQPPLFNGTRGRQLHARLPEPRPALRGAPYARFHVRAEDQRGRAGRLHPHRPRRAGPRPVRPEPEGPSGGACGRLRRGQGAGVR